MSDLCVMLLRTDSIVEFKFFGGVYGVGISVISIPRLGQKIFYIQIGYVVGDIVFRSYFHTLMLYGISLLLIALAVYEFVRNIRAVGHIS